ncbi:hypothetical protein E4U59_000547 [Claviceps monticola]|nr:hypothetical protein E4U59_000547 [Claviceps monticola]
MNSDGEPRRGSSDSRRSNSDSRRHYSQESQQEEVEEIANTPRVGGLEDMYRVVMQLLQQQSITQQQQNATQAALQEQKNTTQAALLQLINRGQPQPTLPSTSGDYQDAAQVQSGPRLRPSDIGFFDPDVVDEKGQGVIAEGKSSTTIYKCVLAFTQRLEDMAESHSEKAVKENWIACLKGQALLWHSRHLTQAERQRLREASLDTICKRLVERFRESQSAVLDRIKKAKFTLQKYHSGESLTIFVNNLLQDARAYFNEEIAQIRTVHQAFDSQIQLVIPPPTDGMTVDQFLVQLRDRESTISALARDKFKTVMNQRFRDSRNAANDRHNRRQQNNNYRNSPRPQGQQLGQYQGQRYHQGQRGQYQGGGDNRNYHDGYQNRLQDRYQRPLGQNDARNRPRPDADRAVVPFGDMSRRDTARQSAGQYVYNANTSSRDQENWEDDYDQYDECGNQDVVDQAQMAQEGFPYPEVEWDAEYIEGWRGLPADENVGEKVQRVGVDVMDSSFGSSPSFIGHSPGGGGIEGG